MSPRLACCLALIFCAVPAGAQDAPLPACADEPAAPNYDQMTEAELRALLLATWNAEERGAGLAALQRRFPSPSARAFAANLDAATRLQALEPEEAFDVAGRVRAEFSGSADPAVALEVARAIRLQAQARDLRLDMDQESGARTLRSADFGPDNAPNRLRRELIETYGARPEPALRAIVGEERYNLEQARSIAYGASDHAARMLALAAYYQDSDDPALVALVGEILFDVALSEQNPERKIGYIDEFLRRYAERPGGALAWDHVASAFGWKAAAQEQLGDAAGAARTRREAEAWEARTEHLNPYLIRCVSED